MALMGAESSQRPSVLKLGLSLPLAAIATSLALFCSNAEAYIPSSRTIVGRVAKNHGKGIYAIEQEVQIRTAGEPITLRERWVIENGENMRLTVASPKGAQEPSRYDAVYRGGKKTAPDFLGGLKTSNMPPEFVESFSHSRSGRGFVEALVRSGIVPGSFMRERPKVVKKEVFTYLPEPLVNLGRSSGVVTWIFGEPTPVDATKQKAAVWIEQDAFLLRRLRFPSEAELTADKHSSYSGALRLPRERTITWGSNSATIRVISVKTVSPANAASFLAPNSVSANDARAARLPDVPQVKEFYSRFR